MFRPLFRRVARSYVTKYTKSHEWINFDQKTMGITQHAIDELGEITYADFSLADSGADVAAQDPICEVESVKTTSQIYSPVSGTLAEFNTEVQENPSVLNEKGQGAWLWRFSQVQENEELLSEEEYNKFLSEESH